MSPALTLLILIYILSVTIMTGLSSFESPLSIFFIALSVLAAAFSLFLATSAASPSEDKAYDKRFDKPYETDSAIAGDETSIVLNIVKTFSYVF
jgi:hypothetical protein